MQRVCSALFDRGLGLCTVMLTHWGTPFELSALSLVRAWVFKKTGRWRSPDYEGRYSYDTERTESIVKAISSITIILIVPFKTSMKIMDGTFVIRFCFRRYSSRPRCGRTILSLYIYTPFEYFYLLLWNLRAGCVRSGMKHAYPR